MRLDILHALKNIGADRSWTELLDETRYLAQRADELGFDGFWLGEHHFDAYGTDQCPNPVMLSADLAARTKRIHLGIAAVILPLWHPVRLAEDLAMLDHFSGGRLNVALSRGILQAEIVNLNPEADRKDDARSKAIFAENLEIMRSAWTETPFSWKSERYEFPHPTTKWPPSAEDPYTDEQGKTTGLAVIPQPLQSIPPLYSVTDTPGGFVAAAEQGIGAITWYPTGKVLDGLARTYVEAAEKAGTLAPGEKPRLAILRQCGVAPTDEEARRMVEPDVNELYGFIKDVRGIKVWLDEDEDPNDPYFENTDPFDILLERDHLLVGSPQSVAERLIRMIEEHGIDHILLSFFNGQSDSDIERSMRLMAEEVAPIVRAATGAEVTA